MVDERAVTDVLNEFVAKSTMGKFVEITKCRICSNQHLDPVLHLGSQFLTGVFPDVACHQDLTIGPLELVKCREQRNNQNCGLVQLRHSYDPLELYGQNYGYRSSLNRAMIEHLRCTVRQLLSLVPLKEGEMAVDIGSNDGTLLSFYPRVGIEIVGIDPTAGKFERFYSAGVRLVRDFFSAEKFESIYGERKAKIVTSLAMFYDLTSPVDFMRQVSQILAEDGIWHFEQSYLGAMLSATAYDTICHEHLEYYCFRQIKFMTDLVGLKVIDVRFNDVNGGSFAVTVAKKSAPYPESTSLIERILVEEEALGLSSDETYRQFKKRVFGHREAVLELLDSLKASRQLVLGYGASTKGNVILQFCGIGPQQIPCIGDVNEDKFGCFTPGSKIPIVSEQMARSLAPSHWLVLPWHFRKPILDKERDFLKNGGKIIFPLPKIEIVEA